MANEQIKAVRKKVADIVSTAGLTRVEIQSIFADVLSHLTVGGCRPFD